MADVITFNSWAVRMAQLQRGEVAAPNPANFYLILLNGSSSIDRTSTITALAGFEITTIGYTRKNTDLIALGTVTYNASTNRAEYPTLNVDIAAAGASLQFDAIVLLADANSTIGDTTGYPVWFYELSPQTIPDGAAQTIQIANWGFANIGSAAGT